NFPLTRYLISQVTQSQEDRMRLLRKFVPNANEEEWKLFDAGKRVQILKKDEKMGGILEFGTEMIVSSDKTLSALLGASPGASTAVSIMIDLIASIFPDLIQSNVEKMKTIIPSYGINLRDHPGKSEEIIATSNAILGLGGG